MILVFKFMYWMIVTPFAWVSRFLGVRFLHLGFDADLDTYWTRKVRTKRK